MIGIKDIQIHIMRESMQEIAHSIVESWSHYEFEQALRRVHSA